MCSSTFIGVQINASMQVTDVSDIRRTIIQTSEIGRLAVQPLPDNRLELAAHASCRYG
jgi:hypothetical protein